MNNKNGMVYEEDELPVALTAEEFRASLEAFVANEGGELIANEDGTYTVVSLDGGRVTVGQIWE